jgi:2-iminoacetate synthase ThiH
MVKLIEEVDRIPIERDSLYEEIKREPKRPLIPLVVG